MSPQFDKRYDLILVEYRGGPLDGEHLEGMFIPGSCLFLGGEGFYENEERDGKKGAYWYQTRPLPDPYASESGEDEG